MTTQASEKIRVDGIEYFIDCLPLSPLQDKLPSPQGRISSGRWRGYRADWALKEGPLYLMSLHDTNGHIWEDAYQAIHATSGTPVLAEWFTGRMKVGRKLSGGMSATSGTRLPYSEWEFVFENGRLVEREKKFAGTIESVTGKILKIAWLAGCAAAVGWVGFQLAANLLQLTW